MIIRKIQLIVILLLLYVGCSNNVSSGSSSSGNAKVLSGIILDKNGVGVENISVALRTVNDNQILNIDTTIFSGTFLFNVDKTEDYTILAKTTNGLSAFTISRHSSSDSTLDTLLLTPTATVKIIANLEVNTTTDSIKILGTGLSYPLSSSTIIDNDKWEITCTDVPAGILPKVVISKDTTEELLVNSITTFSGDSSTVVIKNSDAIYQWRVPITVSVKQEVADNYGGIESMKPLIKSWLDSASKIITKQSSLSAEYYFYADSFSVFSGSANTEGLKELNGASQRLIYTDSAMETRALTTRANVNKRLQFFWLSSTSFSFFQQWDLELLTHFLVEGRGALPLNYQNASSGDFPIPNTGFTTPASIMNRLNYSNFMSNYTANVLLENRDKIGTERDILTNAIPDTIKIIDSTALIDTLFLFGVELYSDTVNADTLLTVVGLKEADSTVFILPRDIFFDTENIKYGNILLLSNTSLIKWLPISEVGEMWFNGDRKIVNINF